MNRFRRFQHIPELELLAMIGLVLCSTSFAVQYGVRHSSANRAVVLFQFKLVSLPYSSYFWQNEVMELRDWLGAAFIVSASLLSGKLCSGQ